MRKDFCRKKKCFQQEKGFSMGKDCHDKIASQGKKIIGKKLIFSNKKRQRFTWFPL